MKSVLLLRHAKSDWDADFAGDHERPLANRGRRAASLVGRFIRSMDAIPDRCLCSTARRAADTLTIAAESGGWSSVQRLDRASLYGAGPAEVVTMLRALPDAERMVLFVGHEPGWSATVGHLTGGSRVRMPTAAIARVDFDQDHWADCEPGSGLLVWLVSPRILSVFE